METTSQPSQPKVDRPLDEATTNEQNAATQEHKPPTLIGMVANIFHHLSLRETAAFIRHKPLAGVAFIFIFILLILSIAVSIGRRSQPYIFTVAPTPPPILATPSPILSTTGKTLEFQTLEATLGGILEAIKNVDLSESQLATPLLESNITFEN